MSATGTIIRLTANAAIVLFLALATGNAGELRGSLQTAETHLQFFAGDHAPQLLVLRQGISVWENRLPEVLISSVEIAGQIVPIQWNLDAERSRMKKNEIDFVYDSNPPHLRLHWEWESRSDHGPVEHEVRIENLDSRETWIPLQNSFVFNWRISPGDKLHQFYVEKGADTPSSIGTHLVPINDGYKWEGTSSTYAQPRPGEAREIIPYLLVEQLNKIQQGWYAGIEFSGRTHLTLNRYRDSLQGEMGLNPHPGPFRTRLLPGESFETPRIFLGASSGRPDATANVLRRWVREVLGSHSTWSDPHYPLLVNNSWGNGMAVNDGLVRRMIDDAAELGFEMFHLDAGWFRGVGDWFPDTTKFPSGLGPVVDQAHARGLKFGLWTDWAQAGTDRQPGALNVRDPEVSRWLTANVATDWKPEDFKGQTIDIGVRNAETWVMRETDRIVSAYHLDMLEHDGYLVAKGCDSSDHPHAPPDPQRQCAYRDSGFVFLRSSNSTDVSYRATRSYYEIQTNLRRSHPGLLLEICNDGGRMVDFGSAAHGDYFSMTDTYDPVSNRRAFYDASFVLPPAMLEAYVERWPAPRLENFRYMLRSGMMGWFSLMMDTTSWDAQRHNAAKEEISLYKNLLRPLIREADLYHVSERPDGVRWDGMEYFDIHRRRGVVYVFRGSTSASEHKFVLQGLNAKSRYQVRFHDHSSDDQVVFGRKLMKNGLSVRLPLNNSSEVVFLQELAPVLAPESLFLRSSGQPARAQ